MPSDEIGPPVHHFRDEPYRSCTVELDGERVEVTEDEARTLVLKLKNWIKYRYGLDEEVPA